MAEVDRRFGLVAQLQLEDALTYAELSERAVPAPTMHAARILLGTGDELNGDLAKLRKPASAATELRVLSALANPIPNPYPVTNPDPNPNPNPNANPNPIPNPSPNPDPNPKERAKSPTRRTCW